MHISALNWLEFKLGKSCISEIARERKKKQYPFNRYVGKTQGNLKGKAHSTEAEKGKKKNLEFGSPTGGETAKFEHREGEILDKPVLYTSHFRKRVATKGGILTRAIRPSLQHLEEEKRLILGLSVVCMSVIPLPDLGKERQSDTRT